jgi:hypothetical protein
MLRYAHDLAGPVTSGRTPRKYLADWLTEGLARESSTYHSAVDAAGRVAVLGALGQPDGWNQALGVLAPRLIANAFGLRVTVIGADGAEVTYGPRDGRHLQLVEVNGPTGVGILAAPLAAEAAEGAATDGDAPAAADM